MDFSLRFRFPSLIDPPTTARRGCRLLARARRAEPLTLALVAALAAAIPVRGERVNDLRPQGYTNDFAGVLDVASADRLTRLCEEVDRKAHAQIAVVTIRSLEGAAIEDFAVELYKRWGIGYKPENRGVLILLAVADRKYRIEVGYGLEPILPDGKVGGFGRETVPLLRQGDYGGALLQLTWQVSETIATDRGVPLEAAPPTTRSPAGAARRPNGLRPWLTLLSIFLVFFLLFRGGSGWWLGPLIGGAWMGGGRSWGGGGFGGRGGFGGFGGGISGGGGASGSW